MFGKNAVWEHYLKAIKTIPRITICVSCGRWNNNGFINGKMLERLKGNNANGNHLKTIVYDDAINKRSSEMAQKKRGPVKGSAEWNKKVMGNWHDERRVKNLSESLFGAAKTPDKIFAGGKSELYPKRAKSGEAVKKFVSKAVRKTRDMTASVSKRKKK